MKRYLLIFFTVIIVEFSSAQPYQSVFGKTSTTWVIEWGNLDFSAATDFFVMRDTVFNSISYKEVVGSSGQTDALIREDTISGKVWIIDLSPACLATNTTEKLVADLSLQLGETFNIKDADIQVANPSDTLIIVDSVYYLQGKKHIRFSTPTSVYPNEITEPITFIEGVGPNYSPLWINQPCTNYLDKYLLCVYKDSVKADYTNLRFNGDCAPDFAGITGINKGFIDISPNPFSSHISISLQKENLHQATVTITDLLGQTIYRTEETNLATDYNKMLDLSYLANGVYFVEVSTPQPPKGEVIHEVVKVVKQ